MATGTGVSLVISATNIGRATRPGDGVRVVDHVAADDPHTGLDDRGRPDQGLAHGGLDRWDVPAILRSDPPAQRPARSGRAQPAAGVDRAEAAGAEDPEIGHVSAVRRRPCA